ncbi:T9SS type A sorting domain-containing protein [Chryseobacterium sp. MP_3.2]|uniref:T9SS type A sorting domain-containing protein n=1 Tax=Chryseobacterium sp. MP_3.2 TaxID=3071712 RepID=UPI002DF9A025|nr:hypothetical protein [Chryseobacterium sp. MP_3.2]
MIRNLLTVALLSLGVSAAAQNVISSVNSGALFYVSENTLVYNGGGLQTTGTGVLDVRGDVMVVGASGDALQTLNAAGTAPQLSGGNIILRINNPANYASTTAPSTYGQLYINGIAQSTLLTAIVDKEFRTAKNGTYQQIALPFYQKQISSLSGTGIGTLGKTFNNTRYSKNEVLTWNNTTVVSDNFNVSSTTPKGNTYYMLGSNNLDTGNPPASMAANPSVPAIPNGSVYTLRGVPFTNGIVESLSGAGYTGVNPINFGPGGSFNNSYNEKYNTYLQDDWDLATPWTANFGRNIYQFGNPYLINLDLSQIGIVEATPSDGNAISTIKGIRFDPGTVKTLPGVGTYSENAKFVNFTSANPSPVGDVGLIIRPMQTFVIKLNDNLGATLNFDGLRRFKYSPRSSATPYSPTAKQGQTNSSVKQLGIIGLDADGNELARAYYAVYPSATSGYTTGNTVQSRLGSGNILGTYEEDAINGGYDNNYINNYWLYINEANEEDFKGKAIPLALYSSAIKSLKFEIRENAQLIENGVHNLSTGVGFYYKSPTGQVTEIAQNQTIPVNSEEYNLYFGKPNTVLSTNGNVKPSRTVVAYNKSIDKFVVRFDPLWKNADIQVYDMSGKLVITQKSVKADNDYEITLSKGNSSYIVTATSETGEKISSKIIR